MSRQQPRQPFPSSREQQEGTADAVHRSGQVVSPYLTADGAVRYLALGSKSSLYHHVRENQLPTCRVGRHLRFDVRELDSWVRGFGSALEQKRTLAAVRKVS